MLEVFDLVKEINPRTGLGEGVLYMVIEVKPGSPTLYGIGGANASDQIEKWLPEEKLEKWVVEAVRAGRDKPVKLDAVVVADDKTAFSGICPKCGRIVSFDFDVVGYCNRCAQCIDTEPEHYLGGKYTTLEEAKVTSEELKLLRSFPGSVVNSKGMFVPEPDDIAGFSLMEEWMGPEIKCRVLERLSWAAAFAMPYGDRQKDRELREFYRRELTYLGTEFTRDDLKLVCKKAGNAINHGLTLRFVMHGYDLTLLEEDRW